MIFRNGVNAVPGAVQKASFSLHSGGCRIGAIAAAANVDRATEAAGEIGPGNLAGEFFEQFHAQRRVFFKDLGQRLDGQDEQGAGRLGAEGIGVVPVSEGGGQLDQISGARRTQGEPGIEPFCFANEESRDHDIESLALAVLSEDDVAGIELDALRGSVEQISGLRRTLQQLRQWMGSDSFDSLRQGLGLLGSVFHFYSLAPGVAMGGSCNSPADW